LSLTDEDDDEEEELPLLSGGSIGVRLSARILSTNSAYMVEKFARLWSSFNNVLASRGRLCTVLSQT
jgi:hypothetical protein